MKKKTHSIAFVRKEVSKVLGKGSGTNFDIGVALMSACVVGPNIVRVAKFARLSRELIREPFNRLRKNLVFIGPTLNVKWFEKDGGTSFIIDVLAARGLIKRKNDETLDQATQ